MEFERVGEERCFWVSELGAMFSCALLTGSFVGSLYLWPQSARLDRNSPLQIKRRFLSVGLVCLLSFIFLFLAYPTPRNVWEVLRWMGVHFSIWNNVVAMILPLLLTMILFLGPLMMLYYDQYAYYSPKQLCHRLVQDVMQEATNLITWRNYIIGPFTEEWVFRACMCPLLICGGFSWTQSIFLSPFFFGGAHLHHIIQHLHKQGEELKDAWLEVLFQLFYTTVFGCYSAFLFLRTGNILAPFLAHAFCNFMGFPDIQELPTHSHKQRIVYGFIGGMVGFCLLLFPLTNPSFYGSIFA